MKGEGMPNKRITKKIAAWFFEEDKDAEHSGDDQIELNVWQLVMVVAVTIVFLGWIFYSYRVNDNNMEFVLSPPEYIAKFIEKNYFENNHGIKNGDFSRGMAHWKTSDGGRIFPESQSRASLNSHDYHSAPYSLEIQTIVPANRYYYVKKIFDGILENPYHYQSDVFWLGVPVAAEVTARLWYKGDILTFYLQGLKNDGKLVDLGNVSGAAAGKWTELVISRKIPDDVRAIGIELTLNQAEGMPAPRVLIDDVTVTVGNKEQ